MNYICNDGGRLAAGFKGDAGDCTCRAVSIATGRNYQEVYDEMNARFKKERFKKKSNALNGVYKNSMINYMYDLGFTWVPTKHIGSTKTVHMRASELPQGTIIVNLSKHHAAVIDGVVHDTYDCTRDGMRMVYGYWIIKE